MVIFRSLARDSLNLRFSLSARSLTYWDHVSGSTSQSEWISCLRANGLFAVVPSGRVSILTSHRRSIRHGLGLFFTFSLPPKFGREEKTK